MELTVEQTLQQGVAAHKEGKLKDAERLYRAILHSQPSNPDANHNLGVLAVSCNKVNVALPLFKIALEANPKIEQFWLSYIDALIKEKQFNTAKQALEQAKKRGLAEEKLNTIEAQLSSETQIQNVNSKNPPQEQLSSLLEYYKTGRYGDAEKIAMFITQEFPKHQFGWKVLGAVLKKTGRISESLAASQKSVQLAPQDAEAHNILGNTFKILGRLEEAEASYTKAIALRPDYFLAHYNLGNTLSELCRLKEAEVSYTQAIILKLDFAEAHYNLGNTLNKLGRLEEAEASYTQAITLKPDFTSALMNRWQLLFDKKEFDAALRDVDFCNTEISRVQSLETLYALERIDEIYNRIEKQSELDDKNLRMAAFSSFISAREKKETEHKFCRNPLSFIHYSNISSHLGNSTEFVKEVIDELNNVKTIWEPRGKSALKGFVTTSEFNLFASPSGKLAQLKSIIFDEIDAYYLKFRKESCSYITKWPSKINLYGWHVVLKQQGCQTAHIHPSGWLSGVIYLKVVPPLGKDEGAIEFSLNGKNYYDVNSPSLTFQPELGDIVFFPSSLHHRTIPYMTDTDRIIVSFDLMPEAAKQ